MCRTISIFSLAVTTTVQAIHRGTQMQIANEFQGATRLKPLAVSVNDAAWLIGISRAKLYQMIAAGRVKSTKIDKRTVITYASLEALLGTDKAAA